MFRQPDFDMIRGSAPAQSPNVRVLAAFSGHADCRLAALGFAAGIDFDRLLAGTPYAVPFGQSPYAFQRGQAFERSLSRDGYGPLLSLLRSELRFKISDARIANLRNAYTRDRQGLRLRAHETRTLLREIVRRTGSAPNIIDGAVLETELGGVRAHFEADSLATTAGGPVHTGEVKSFPVVDGRADPEKLAAAIDQASVYTLLARLTVAELGGDPAIVSSHVLLITPRNVGLTPTLQVYDARSRIARVELLLSRAPDIRQLAVDLPPGLGFAPVAQSAGAPERRIEALHALADAVGTRYVRTCLADCGLARFCRSRAFSSGQPSLAGPQTVRMLPGVATLDRAVELAAGAPPSPREEPAAAQLQRAARLYNGGRAVAAGGARPR
jgi:hypothetical protein